MNEQQRAEARAIAEDLKVSDAHLSRLQQAVRTAEADVALMKTALQCIEKVSELIDDEPLRDAIQHLAQIRPPEDS